MALVRAVLVHAIQSTTSIAVAAFIYYHNKPSTRNLIAERSDPSAAERSVLGVGEKHIMGDCCLLGALLHGHYSRTVRRGLFVSHCDCRSSPFYICIIMCNRKMSIEVYIQYQ